MSSEKPRRLTALWRFLASWYTPATLAAVVLLSLAAWAMPRRIERVVTDAATGEGRTVTAWDTSNWQALAAVWWQVLLLTLAAVALGAGVWVGRGRVLRAAAAVRFFAASLLLHGLLVLWMCAVPLARAVVARAEILRSNQAAELSNEGPRPVQGGGQSSFEKLADLKAEESAAPNFVRQAPVANVPGATDPLAPTIPAHAVRSLPPERLLFVPSRQQLDLARLPAEVERRGTVRALKPVEVPLDPPPLLPPEAAPKEKPLAIRPVAHERREPVVPSPADLAPLPLPDLKPSRRADLRPEETRRPGVSPAETVPAELTGRRQPGRIAPAAPSEPKAELKAEATPADRPSADVRVDVPRLTTPRPPAPAQLPDEPLTLPPPLKPPTVVPVPGPQPSPPRAPLVARTLPRAPAVPVRPATVEDPTAPPPTLLLRQKEVRQRSVELFGGTRASEAAVERGLDWLAAHQNPNGSWSLHTFHTNCKHPRCPDAGTYASDPAGTGIVLLPFLGAGNTHQAGKHKQTVARALHWLVGHQQQDGTWPAPGDARPMYGHGMASIALCEAYGMTRDAKLRGPAQKALDYIIRAQHGPSGGWRYRPNQPADTSVVGWQLMALKSGEMAGLSVPPKVFEGVKRWLALVEVKPAPGGRFGYQSANPTPAMTAQGLLCLQYLGARRDDPRMRAGTDYLLKNLPRPGAETSYYWYHATQVMYHVQGRHWQAWNGRLRDLLVWSQVVKGPQAGSWTPQDYREKPGGRLYATALRVLMLEVYYRHLPLYQQLEK